MFVFKSDLRFDQYIAQKVGPKVRPEKHKFYFNFHKYKSDSRYVNGFSIIFINITKLDPILSFPNIYILQKSLFALEKTRLYLDRLGIGQFNLLTSDIAPSTTGMTGIDQYRSIELNLAILEVAEVFLKK